MIGGSYQEIINVLRDNWSEADANMAWDWMMEEGLYQDELRKAWATLETALNILHRSYVKYHLCWMTEIECPEQYYKEIMLKEGWLDIHPIRHIELTPEPQFKVFWRPRLEASSIS